MNSLFPQILSLIAAGLMLLGCHSTASNLQSVLHVLKDQPRTSVEKTQLTSKDTATTDVTDEHFTRDKQEMILRRRKVERSIDASSAMILARPDISISIHPGALMWWDAVRQGNFNPVNVNTRLPLKAALSGGEFTRNDQPIGGIDFDGTASDFKTQLAKIKVISNATNLDYQILSARSIQEAVIQLGLSASYFGVAEGSVKVNSKDLNRRSSFVIALKQSYFTVGLDLPTLPAGGPLAFRDLRGDAATKLSREIGERKAEIAYVSDVNYGRYAFLLITSELSRSELNVAANAAANWLVAGGETSLDAKTRTLLDQSEIRCVIVGSVADDNVGKVIEGSFDNIANRLKTYLAGTQKINSLTAAVPISFSLRYARDNATAYVGETMNYAYWEPFLEIRPGQTLYKEIAIKIGPPINALTRDTEMDIGDSAARIWVKYRVQTDEPKTGVLVDAEYLVHEFSNSFNKKKDTEMRGSESFKFNLVSPGFKISTPNDGQWISKGSLGGRIDMHEKTDHGPVAVPNLDTHGNKNLPGARNLMVKYDRDGDDDHLTSSCKFMIDIPYTIAERVTDITP
ncbi:MAG: thiol-activated cytolysin family protein [Burkholderiales bacterium]|nr:thiol-activated cytolysin family protein [Phycisphaerae bacterium]